MANLAGGNVNVNPVSTPVHFGTSGRRLFGMLHVPGNGQEPQRGFLLCAPFGQERIRLHRFFKVLADHLCRHDALVLRFDYFGTGDSDGSDEEADYDGWLDDVRTAHGILASHGAGARVLWFGAGLGATLAMAAFAKVQHPPTRLVLWEPLLDGPAYLETLRRRHVETLEASYSLWDPAWRRALARDPDAFTDEAIGFATPPRLRQGLGAVTPSTVGRELTCDVDVVVTPGDAVIRQWVASLDSPLRRVALHSVAVDIEWTAEQLRGAALVPTAALNTIVSLCNR